MRLKKYLDEKGIQRKWFAEKLGVEPLHFSQMLCMGYIPPKYWKKVMAITDKRVTLEDLYEEYYNVLRGDKE